MSACTTEEIHKIVYDSFDELLLALQEQERLHPSENCHKQWWRQWKFYENINSYHVFCRFCNKHIYSRSVPTDINSFFQEHVNTEYHRELRSGFPHSKEMIVWTDKWKTAKCNVCRISDIYAFVIDPVENLKLVDLIREHHCLWEKEIKENNLKTLNKINLLKKYCQLSIFQKKFIRLVDKESACLLCRSKIPWSEEKVKNHLGSQKHFSQFCWLVWNKFNMSPKDLLNGINLEIVIRWISWCNFKEPPVYADYDSHRLKCCQNSLNSSLKQTSQSTGCYRPIDVEKLLDPSYNRDKVMKSSAMRYLSNYKKIIKKYKELKEGVNYSKLKIGNINPTGFSTQWLLLKKLKLIKKPYTELLDGEFCCEVCDIRIPDSLAVNHATDPGHLFHSLTWQEIEKLSADNRFFEVFWRCRSKIFCLLCGAPLKEVNFFTHLKSTLHRKRFREYCELKNEVPISVAIQQQPGVVMCLLCDRILIRGKSLKECEGNFKAIWEHWACHSSIKQKKEKEEIVKGSKEINGQCLICRNYAKCLNSGCPANKLNFKKLENVVEAMVNACEDVILKLVLRRTESVVRKIEDVKAKRRQEVARPCEKPKFTTFGSDVEDEEEEEDFGKKWSEDETNSSQDEESDKEKAEEEELKISINSDMLELLEQPWKLLDFVTNLAVAANVASESSQELELEKAVCTTINKAVLSKFPNCCCYPFGSRLSGLTLDNSNLDVFLDCGNVSVMNKKKKHSKAQNMYPTIFKVGKLLRRETEVSDLKFVFNGHVHVASFRHKSTNIQCDLSLENGLSVHNTLLIKYLVSLNYQAQLIILFLKHWIKNNGINGPAFFSSYAITLMAIFYFQQLNPPMMPTVEELQNAFVGRRITIAGWDCSLDRNVKDFGKQDGNYPIHTILQGFFTYYAEFDYDRFIISPLNGKPLSREAFNFDSPELPLCYKRHLLNLPKNLELVCQDIPICLIDPFELSHVVTKNLTLKKLEIFKHLCVLSANALERGILGVLSCNEEIKTSD